MDVLLCNVRRRRDKNELRSREKRSIINPELILQGGERDELIFPARVEPAECASESVQERVRVFLWKKQNLRCWLFRRMAANWKSRKFW